jgi:hypothetical protein
VTTIAACAHCGNVAPARKPGAGLGKPAGPCSRCGHLMFWTAEDQLPKGPAVSRSLDGAVGQARQARRDLSPERARPPDTYIGTAI